MEYCLESFTIIFGVCLFVVELRTPFIFANAKKNRLTIERIAEDLVLFVVECRHLSAIYVGDS